MHTSRQHYIHLVRYAVDNNMRNGGVLRCVTLVRYDGALRCCDDMRNGGALRCVTLVRYAVGDDASYADALR